MIHFDSHVDTVDETGGERYSHASPFIRAVEEGFLDPKRMLSIGIKGPLNTRRDLDYAKQNGVEILTYEAWRRDGDTPYAPGTGTPSIGGFTSAEALAMLRSLRGINLVGADVVEVLPDRDPAGITALLAAHIMFEIICLDAVKRR